MTAPRGVTRTDSILDRIVADKRDRLDERTRARPEASLRGQFEERGDGQLLPLGQALAGPPQNGIDIIAEIKKASPSRGVLAADLDHRRVARQYALGGAIGISVVTEENHFLGSPDWLGDVRRLLEAEFPAQRPSLLRKDFLIDPYEISESRALGADNVLLIAALLDDALLSAMIAKARDLGLDALVEVHTEAEAERAVAAGAGLFGINNRDLHSFAVDLATTERIRPLLPLDAVVIGESGVNTKADADRLLAAGVRAILVGEAFMTAPDVAAKLAELRT